ncbi:MAG: NADP-dependent oxidoreductase [Acidobacteriaceae bacterium]
MKAVVLDHYGPPSNLCYRDVPTPVAGPNQVLIEVRAVGVNPIDWKMRAGQMRDLFPLQFPIILGFDVAGVVRSCGLGVTSFGVGERIFGRASAAYAEWVAGEVSCLAKIPAGVDFTTAAALPVVSTTADQLIRRAIQAQKGQTILLTGALGSVGRLALFCAVELGVQVIAGVRSSQISEALALGAARAVDVGSENDLSSLGPVDAIADCVGGDLGPRLLPLVKPEGVYGSIVGPPRRAEQYPSVRIQAIGSQPDPEAMVRIATAIGQGRLKLPISLVLPLAQAAEAHIRGERGGEGKIVLTP